MYRKKDGMGMGMWQERKSSTDERVHLSPTDCLVNKKDISTQGLKKRTNGITREGISRVGLKRVGTNWDKIEHKQKISQD